MNLTKEEAIKEFRAHWDWLSWNPALPKNAYPGLKGKDIIESCFLCQFCTDGEDRHCKKCPIEWPETNNNCAVPCTRSYYYDWVKAKTPTEKSRLAALIRDLPEKEEEVKPDFKVGQWVKVLVEEYNFSENCGLINRSQLPQLPWARPIAGNCYKIIGVSDKPDSRYGYIYALISENGNTISFMHKGYTNEKTAQPDGLVLTEEPKPALKVGDWVKVLDAGNCYDTYQEFFKLNNLEKYESKFKRHSLPKKEQSHQIIAIGKHEWRGEQHNPIYVIQSQQNGQIYLMDNEKGKVLELTTPPAKFKLGDRVKVIKAINGHPLKLINETGVIKAFASNGECGVDFDKEGIGLHGLTGCVAQGELGRPKHCWWLKPEELEITPPAPKYAVGDKVVPISKTAPGFEQNIETEPYWKAAKERGYFYIARICYDLYSMPGQLVYQCHDKESSTFGNYYLESDLTPYVEPKKEVKVESRFQVGDRVRVKPDLIPGNQYGNLTLHNGFMSKERGREGVVMSVGKTSLSISGSCFIWDFEMLEIVLPRNHAPENKTIVESKTFIFKDNKTTCIIEIDGQKWTGCAWCEPSDEFDYEIGKQWAELRATRKMLDACEKELRG